MQQLTKATKAKIRKELPRSAEMLRNVILKKLGFLEKGIPDGDISEIVKFGKFKAEILQAILTFETISLEGLLDHYMGRITGVAGGEDDAPKVCPECDEQLNSKGKCDSACCKEDRV
jgi:hypothetical protein